MMRSGMTAGDRLADTFYGLAGSFGTLDSSMLKITSWSGFLWQTSHLLMKMPLGKRYMGIGLKEIDKTLPAFYQG